MIVTSAEQSQQWKATEAKKDYYTCRFLAEERGKWLN